LLLAEKYNNQIMWDTCLFQRDFLRTSREKSPGTLTQPQPFNFIECRKQVCVIHWMFLKTLCDLNTMVLVRFNIMFDHWGKLANVSKSFTSSKKATREAKPVHFNHFTN
jgi:hypothetical protein